MATCKTVDPECASEPEIDEWLRTKKVMFSIINSKIGYKNYYDIVRQNEMFLPSIPLGPNTYSDTGYRFRQNTFEGEDSWNPFKPANETIFYDYTFFNTEVMVTDSSKTIRIADMYFRIDTDRYIHTRSMYSMMDWLGDVGGIGDVLKFGFLAFFGSYLSFNVSVQAMSSLYAKNFELDHHHQDDGPAAGAAQNGQEAGGGHGNEGHEGGGED